MPEENVFDVESMLTTTEFTIPVTIEEPAQNGSTPKKRPIKVTYNFDEEVSKSFADGKPNPDFEKEKERVDAVLSEFEGDELEKQKKKNPQPPEKVTLNLNEQLAMLVKKIDGVETQPTVEFWAKVRFRYRTAILEQILKDIYPNAKIAGG